MNSKYKKIYEYDYTINTKDTYDKIKCKQQKQIYKTLIKSI